MVLDEEGEVQSAVAMSDALVTTESPVMTEMTKGYGAVELMMWRMNGDAAARDEGRASRLVATVGPAMTAVKYAGTKNVGTSSESSGNGQKSKTEKGAAPGEAPSTAKTVKMVESVNAVDAVKMTTVERDAVDVVKATTATGFGDDDVLESAATSCSCDTVASYEPWLDCELAMILANDVPNLHNEQRKLPQEELDTKCLWRARREARKAGERQMKILAVANDKHEPIGDQQRSAADRQVRRSREMVQALQEADDRERGGRRDWERVANDERSARVRLRKQSYEDTYAPHGSERVVEYARADDGLPTAMMKVKGVRQAVKFDSCARYSVVGTEWMQYGERLSKPPPVDCIEGIGGITLAVIGIWEFELKTIFNDVMKTKACVVKGCKEEFQLGVDFMQEHGATIDFEKHEVRYRSNDHTVVIPFRTHDEGRGAETAAVRMAYSTRLKGRIMTPVEVVVSAVDGERGIFVPGPYTGAVMLATTVTTAKDGYALVPAMNASVESVKVPSKRESGT
ncbi:LOW QUALITY PROTEIN: hypothetical protein PHMEG_00018855 [Phytophthora megakarya]|uniref:Uncharacterized protein n=1 Tax=Phytophthora megakarya TaxID=4795 RepID=A0A225VUB2_9STRA|nr:LOW QUALITY PROTEIN: hypothetical protein PHMEG_00018855 [Phytophthora megakarya]